MTMLQAACVGFFTHNGMATERQWTNLDQNYDHVGNALLSLFVAVTLNGYARKLSPPSLLELPRISVHGFPMVSTTFLMHVCWCQVHVLVQLSVLYMR